MPPTTRNKLDFDSQDKLERDIADDDFPELPYNWAARQIVAGLLISIIAFGCFIYLLQGDWLKDLQTVAIALIVLAALPWLAFSFTIFKSVRRE